MATIGWGDVGRKNSESSGVNFLKFEPGNEYTIRPIGDPKKVVKYFIPGVPGPNGSKGRGAITDAGLNCVVRTKYLNAEGKPQYQQRTKYAFNCINRADGKLAVAEVPSSVASAIRDWGEENNIHPGGPNGCDFKIKVVKTGPQNIDVEYKVFNKNQSPLSAEEQEMTKQVFDLEKIFHATPQNEIEVKLGLVAAPAQTQQAPAVKTAQPQTAAAAAASGGEDLDF